MRFKNFNIILLLLLGVVCSQPTFSQKFADKTFYLVDSLELKSLSVDDRKLIDSLLIIYHQTKEDTSKLLQLNLLISGCENEIWLKYNQLLMDKSVDLINKKKNSKIYKKYLASGYNNLGVHYFTLDDNKKAIHNFNKAIEISKEINNITVIPTALNNLGFIYKQEGDILKALAYYHQSLQLNQELKEESEIALALNNIGGIYFKQKEYDKALKYYLDALLIEKKSGTKNGEARLYSNIGSVYKEQNKLAEAIDYFNYSIKIYTQIGNKKGLATSLSKQASLELKMLIDEEDNSVQLQNILAKHQKALEIYHAINDNEGKSFAMCNISITYKKIGDIESAYQYAEKSLSIAQKLGFPESIKNSAELLKDIAMVKKDYKNAFQMQELFYSMQDSISNQSIKETTIQKQYQYEYEKKSITDSLATAAAQKIKDINYQQEIHQQKTYTIIGVVSLFFMIIVALVILKGYHNKKKNNLELAEKNKVIETKNIEITDSITYAKRIQTAIIPPAEELNQHLKNSFVFYQPKDIVAGDFYWMETVSSLEGGLKVGDNHPINSLQEENIILFAVCDCTGHGVPGAMVSVVCHNALNRVIREYKLVEPAAILDKTRAIVIETFQRSRDNLSMIKDGMDIALCAINFNTNTLQFSGANNPLYIIRNNELVETKPDKQPVGKHHNEKPFTNHTIELMKNDCIYIFSDGYADQFGGPRGKKYMYHQFKELLISINEKEMDEQKNFLANNFDKWRGDLEQVDDVCIIGVRV
ncbi:MAG: hypothetical protein A3K10_14160 [Bacteroidetes bacterium RIFCSPLOWO2_12_FULL_31_6]|nr:MAG: hypothetical protein A3K10_14160 [Bacteroidetes bacterium RIFCSPLOWO2_12_FULL_31_6]